MKKLLNTLYVTSEDSYLSLDGENVVVINGQKEIGRLPLHNLEGIVSFGYRGTSPALMGKCADEGISLTYLNPQGRFLARINGPIKGNVILRHQQFQTSIHPEKSLDIAKNCLIGKVYNARWVLERGLRDHRVQIDEEKVGKSSTFLIHSIQLIQSSKTIDELRGREGEAASVYFSVFDERLTSNLLT